MSTLKRIARTALVTLALFGAVAAPLALSAQSGPVLAGGSHSGDTIDPG